MPRAPRKKSRKNNSSVFKNIRTRVKRFFTWPRLGNWSWGDLIKFGFILGFWGVLLMIVSILILSIGLPDIRQAVEMDHNPIVIMRDRSGAEFARLGSSQGEILKVKDMSPHLVKAVIAIEDRRFYSHIGVDPLGLLRAVWNNMRGGGLQGGSTITQQLTKNIFLSPERTLTRKIKEALLALYIERRYTKDEILAAYLNRAYFGAGAYGVDSAARVYFNTSARDLNLEQSAMLAGLLKAPTHYSPDNDPKLTEKRTRIVLAAMVDAGFLREGAEKMTLKPLPKREYSAGGSMDMRYFADWIMSQVEGYIGTSSQNLIIDTTLDSHLQNYGAHQMRKILDDRGPAMKISQGAFISMTPQGAVLAMEGGRDYAQSQYNRATVSMRQPGSSFKMFVYLAALENGYTPQTTVLDAPIKIGKYAPTNYDGKYHGNLSLQDAVANSLNTVAVRTLDAVGIAKVKNVAQRLGITEPLEPNLSLALGASEVHLLSLTSAYATLANHGMAVEPYGIRTIRAANGEVLYQRRDIPQTPVLESSTVGMMNQMLQAVVQYGTGQRAMLDRPVAGKTGTTSDYRDAWFMGFTSDYVTGVWVGNDDNSSMKKVTGGTIPAQIWHDVMAAAEIGQPVRAIESSYGTPFTMPGDSNMPSNSADTPQPAQPSGSGSVFDNLLENILGPQQAVPQAVPAQPPKDINWDN